MQSEVEDDGFDCRSCVVFVHDGATEEWFDFESPIFVLKGR